MNNASNSLGSSFWGRAIYYGELFGFVVAWAIGALVALGTHHTEPRTPSPADLAQATSGDR